MSVEPLSVEEYERLVIKLKVWFVSQGIRPGDAGIIMLMLIAQLLTERTTDLNELAESVRLHAETLSVEIIAVLKGTSLVELERNEQQQTEH